MRDIMKCSASDGPHDAIRGPHHIDSSGWRFFADKEFELRARLLVRPVGELIIVKCFSTQLQHDDPETAELGASLSGLVKLGYVRILLNLQGVHFASGSLLGSLAALHREAVRANGFVRLFGLEPIVREALRICRLDASIEIYESEAEALSACRSGRAELESRTTEP